MADVSDIFYFFSLGRGKGESEASGGRGSSIFIEIPKGGGSPGGGGAEGPGKCLRRIGTWRGGLIFFFGAEMSTKTCVVGCCVHKGLSLRGHAGDIQLSEVLLVLERGNTQIPPPPPPPILQPHEESGPSYQGPIPYLLWTQIDLMKVNCIRELKYIYHHHHHHHPESKKRKSLEGNSGSTQPYGRYGNAGKTSKTISTIAILWPVKAIFEKRAATVEVDTFISPVYGKIDTRIAIPRSWYRAQKPLKPGNTKKIPKNLRNPPPRVGPRKYEKNTEKLRKR